MIRCVTGLYLGGERALVRTDFMYSSEYLLAIEERAHPVVQLYLDP
jgi:hypothetical protein